MKKSEFIKIIYDVMERVEKSENRDSIKDL